MADIEFDLLGPGDYDRAKAILNKARHPGFVGRELFYRCATGGLACVARIDSTDLGVALVTKGKLAALSVVAAAQGKGVGTALVARVAPKWVNAIMDKVPWFERLGYRPVGAPKVGQSGKMAVQLMELPDDKVIDIGTPTIMAGQPEQLAAPTPKPPPVPVVLAVYDPIRERTRKLAMALIRSKHDRDIASFSLADFCGTHAPQYSFVTDRSRWIHVMCARQSGKTWGDDGILLDNGLMAPRSTNLFLGLKGTGVRTSNWFPIWKPLCQKAGVPDEWHNETEMRTTFGNGARVMFAGTDDLSNTRKYLGNRLDNGVVVLDEAQDQSSEVLRYILKTLLPPMLTPTTRVILSGVLPDVPAGLFYELAADRPLTDRPDLAKSKGWSHHEWGRAANVHTPEAMEQLRDYMREHGLTDDDAQIQRDWYMRRVWNLDATAYRYSLERNGYTPAIPEWLTSRQHGKGSILAAVPHTGITDFTVGIDPGGGDRTSVVGWGWGQETQEVQHVFEWVTERNTSTSLSDIADVCGLFEQHYPGAQYVWDPGSGKMELDTFGADYGIPLIRAATKTDLPGQVRRNNDLLTKGWAKVMIGSKLEEDYQKARWDADARAKGTWRWSTQWHPDPSEAARYGLQGYYAAYSPPEAPDPHRDLKARIQARFAGDRPMWERESVVGSTRDDDPWDDD